MAVGKDHCGIGLYRPGHDRAEVGSNPYYSSHRLVGRACRFSLHRRRRDHEKSLSVPRRCLLSDRTGRDLLGLRHHIIHCRLHVRITQAHIATFGGHGVETLDRTLVQYVYALGETGCPGRLVT